MPYDTRIRSRVTLVLALVALWTSTGCGDSEEPEEPACEVDCEEGTVCNEESGRCEVAAEEACLEAAPWQAGQEAFVDASSDWNLDELEVDGQRLSVTDVDGDGWPDLSVRRAGSNFDEFTDDGERASWLLKNRGGEDFEEITEKSGLVAQRSGEEEQGRPIDVIIWADVDNDGDLDAYTGFNKLFPTGDEDQNTAEIMLNDGQGSFEFGPSDSAVRHLGEVDTPGGASFVDVDRNGRLDLWIAQAAAQNPRQDRLLRGEGDGGFEEVTEQRGLTTSDWEGADVLNEARGHSVGWGAAACDLDGDGTSELLASSYGRAPNHLWDGRRDDGEAHFSNRSIDSGYAFDERVDWTDNESARCYCLHNPEAEECDGVPEPERIACEDDEGLRWNHQTDREPFRLGGNTGTTACADIDNDGRLDLLNNEIVHWDVGSSSDPSEILYNRGEESPLFERPGNEETGLTRERDRDDWDDGDITGAIFDFDNDGRKDIYIGSTDYPGTRGHLWHQQEDGTFERVSIEDGIDHESSHGVAIADFDRDGDLDLAVGHSRMRCNIGNHCYPPEEAHVRLFENAAGDAQNWLQVTLEGAEGTNRSAIGARVTVETDDVTQVSEVGGGHGHYGIQHDLTRHFGLGEACRAEVTVRWPDEDLTEESFVVPAGHHYEWKQGEVPRARPLSK